MKLTPAASPPSWSHRWRNVFRRRPAGARARGGLVRKYAIVLAALVGGTAVAISLVGLWFTYGDTQAATSRLERSAAVLAATRLGPVVFGTIEGRVRYVAGANGELPFSEATRLRRWRSILPRLGVNWGWDRLRYVDPSGRERLRMVRGTVIHERGRLDLARDPLVRAARFQVLAYSAPHLGRGQIAGGTYVTIAAANPQGGVTLIDANTGFFREQLNLFLGGPQLRDFHLVRYLVDDRGRLVARQDPDLQLAHPGPTEPMDTRELPQVKRALASHAENPEPIGRVDGRGLDGQSVISAFARVDPPGWFVIVDEPRSEALGPVYSAALRYGLMVLCALGIAVLAGVLLARRMVRPIGALRDGAVKLGAGELEEPIAVSTGDELEDLAQEFNRMADELQASHAMLEQRVDERTRDLTETLAHNARLLRELETASTQKSAFLANMSHELRTPLNAIIGFAQVLDRQKAGELSERQTAYVQDILGSGRHLLAVIDDVLDLARVEAGRLDLSLTGISIGEVIDVALTMVREHADEHAIALTADVEPGLPEVSADALRIRQVLLNLLINAVKFTPDGGRVQVRARRAEGGVAVEVSDTGVGIPLDEQERIFEEFHRARGVAAVEGTGLGLPLTRRLVELHGGAIAVQSRVGEGSTFRVWLPVGQPARTPSEVA
jgi:signal transduction histidine kinase